MVSYTELIVAGFIISPIMAALIVVPWLRGRVDLFSVWTLFMLGSFNFIGLGMIQNGRGLDSRVLAQHNWTFIAATVVFYSIFSAVYLWPRKSAPAPSPRWLKWPQDSVIGLRVAAVTLSGIAFLFAVIAPGFQGAQLVYVTRTPMAIAGFATAVYLVGRNPKNMVNWAIASSCFAVGLGVALTWGTGRRELLALFIAVPAAAYWTRYRYTNKIKTVLAVGLLSVIGVVSVTAYQTFRHEDRHAESAKERVVSRLVKFPEAIRETVTNWNWFGEGGVAAFDTQNAVACGLRTIHAVEVNESIDRFWFHTPIYVVSNPIPRAFWPGKPVGLGKVLPMAYGNSRITWGPSIIGHCFYDGGWPILLLYAFCLGKFVRYVDGQLAADPANPWPKVLVISVAGHIIGFSRGDCGNFGTNIIGMFVILPILLNLMRQFVGTRPASAYWPAGQPVGGNSVGSLRGTASVSQL